MCELGVDLSVRRVVCWIMSGEVMNLLSNGNYGLQMTHFRLGELLDWNLLEISTITLPIHRIGKQEQIKIPPIPNKS